MATEAKVVKRDDVEFYVDEVKSGGKIVGLSPTVKAIDLDELLAVFPDNEEEVFKLAYRQMRTDHKNLVRAKFNGTGKSAVAVVAGIAAGLITTEEIQVEMKRTSSTFTDAATSLLTTDPDPDVIHWDVLG